MFHDKNKLSNNKIHVGKNVTLMTQIVCFPFGMGVSECEGKTNFTDMVYQIYLCLKDIVPK